MRLVFPGGEHAPVELVEGVTRVGSAGDCELVLAVAGVAAHHCEIVVSDSGAVQVRPLDAGAATVLNGRQLDGTAAVSAGDLLIFGRVGCQLKAGADAPAPSARPAPTWQQPAASEEDDGRTRVRASLPRFTLRGLSGPALGKAFQITGTAVIGRQSDCSIPINSAEVSRQHVRLKPTPTGVHVEDLGSANGTFINDQRIQSGQLMPGDELRLDTIRFVLVAPGMDARQQAAMVQPHHQGSPEPAGGGGGRSSGMLIVGLLVLAAAAAAAAYFGGFLG